MGGDQARTLRDWRECGPPNDCLVLRAPGDEEESFSRCRVAVIGRTEDSPFYSVCNLQRFNKASEELTLGTLQRQSIRSERSPVFKLLDVFDQQVFDIQLVKPAH